MTKSKTAYIAEVDGLRAIAVLGVLFYHYFKPLMPGGLIGVDVFFVISGYLITRIVLGELASQQFSLPAFYGRRIKRIFPALITVLAATFAASYCILTAQEFEQLNAHVLWSNFFALNFKLMSEVDYFNNAAETKPLLHLWSLSIEEQFYIVFPFILLLCHKVKRVILPVMVGIACLSFWFCVSHGQSEQAIAEHYFHPFSRAWELLIGACLAASQRMAVPGWLRALAAQANVLNIVGAAALLALVLSNLLVQDSGAYPNKYVLIPTLATMLIIAINRRAWILRKVLAQPGMLYIGKISYPLYLWHWPVLSLMRVFLNYPPNAWQKVAGLLLSVLLAMVTYWLLERPIQRRSLRSMALTLLGVMLLLAALVWVNGRYALMVPSFNSRSASEYSQASEFYAFDQKLSANRHLLEDLKQERQSHIRGAVCHYHPNAESFSQYLAHQESRCTRLLPDVSTLRTLVVGDSFAADMLMGIDSLNRFSMTQLTGQGCTATLGHYRDVTDNCYRLITHSFQLFAQDATVERIILASRWKAKDLAPLIHDLQKLQTHGKQVIVIGPGLELTDGLYNILYRRSSEDDSAAITRKYVRQDIFTLNQRYKQAVEQTGALYLDRVAPLCASTYSCQLMSATGDIYMWDSGHLTLAGATFLAGKLFHP